jgi:GNAT superfamily N-acetyltransferase
MPLVIREAGTGDLAGILALYAQPDIDDGDTLPVEDAEAIYRRFSDYPDYHLFVADSDGAILGSFALLVMDNLGHRGAPSAVIEDVVVRPGRQGEGIGRRMMEEALAISRKRGCYKASLSANMKRERAHGFYESLGFERHGYSFRVVHGDRR